DEDFATEGFSQELVLNGWLDTLPLLRSADWVLGLYYAEEDLDARRTLFNGAQANVYWNQLLGPLLPPSPVPWPLALEGLWGAEIYTGREEMLALFTHWNFELSDSLKLLFGLRYSVGEKEGQFEPVFFDFPVFVLQQL